MLGGDGNVAHLARARGLKEEAERDLEAARPPAEGECSGPSPRHWWALTKVTTSANSSSLRSPRPAPSGRNPLPELTAPSVDAALGLTVILSTELL